MERRWWALALLFAPLLLLGADTRAFRDLSPAEQVQVMRSEARVALVIGNGTYTKAPLANPSRDAEAVAAALERVGFTVTLKKDLGNIEMKQALVEFGRALEAGGVGLFYYAGHGIQVDGTNYLVPTDAVMNRPDDLEIYGIEAEAVLAKMENAGNRVNIVILDACRNDPFARSSGGGLAMMDARGTFLAYASGAGRVATDEGVYARALTQHMASPGAKIEDVFKRVGMDVEVATRDAQSPWVGSNLRGDFYFVLPEDTGPVNESELSPEPEPEPDDALLTEHGVTMLGITSGSFQMGSSADEEGRDSDETQHTVRISRAFMMSDREVSQGLYAAVMGENPSEIREQWWGGETHGACSKWGVGDELPVHCVDWYDAVRFCNRLSELEGLEPAYIISGDEVAWDRHANGYRLPTEAEWEYAAKAGGASVYAGTSEPEAVCRYGNVANPSTKEKYASWLTWDTFTCSDGYDGLAPVGRFQANAWGLHDMTGNVWEWVWDWYGDYPASPGTDPVGPAVGKTVKYTGYEGPARVFRGGSWAYQPRGVRAAYRFSYEPGFRNYFLGFRLSRSIP